MNVSFWCQERKCVRLQNNVLRTGLLAKYAIWGKLENVCCEVTPMSCIMTKSKLLGPVKHLEISCYVPVHEKEQLVIFYELRNDCHINVTSFISKWQYDWKLIF